jgi:hypothetical protein
MSLDDFRARQLFANACPAAHIGHRRRPAGEHLVRLLISRLFVSLDRETI